MLRNLELQVRKTIQKFGMLAGGEHVVVAASGGPDSVALLLCLHKISPDFRLTLTVAHLNHGIRGAEANGDEQFVSRLSSDLGIPCITESMDLKKMAQAAKRNLEEYAREQRYAFLKRTARNLGACKIAVGHTMNDQAETALFRFIRGTGIKGLSAIHPVLNGFVIRPLLECSRQSIIQYLQEQGASYREDSTNKDSRYSRNRLRNEVIPLLERDFNPQLVATLAREASIARETWAFIESHAREIFEKIHSRNGKSISLSVAAVRNVHPALQNEVLRHGIRECLGSLRGIGTIHIQGVFGLLKNEQSGARVQLPHGYVAIREFEELRFLHGPPHQDPAFSYELRIPGKCPVPEAAIELAATICQTPDLQKIRGTCATQAFLHAPALTAAVTIRSRKPGDRYGGPGHRKVKKMLIDNKIPVSARSTLPMVVCGGKVIWVPGFRPAHGFEVRADSPHCVCIELKRF